MNTFTLILGIITAVSGLSLSVLTIYCLSKKILKVCIPAFLILFLSGVVTLTGFLVTAQEIENYRGNPENNHPIHGEDNF